MTRSLITDITCGLLVIGLFLFFAVSCVMELPGEAERQARINSIYGDR